jgi:hypothetical protein
VRHHGDRLSRCSLCAWLKTYDKSKLDGQLYSTLEVTEDLALLDLASIALRKLGITRKQLIDTEKDQYPRPANGPKRCISSARRHRGYPGFQQDDTTRAVVLFGDRVSPQALRPTSESLSLVNDTATTMLCSIWLKGWMC